MSFWKWSTTAANNATADGTINFAEGQAPSSLNDSSRAVMAAAAKFRQDVSGNITTGGTSTAFTVTTNQNFDTLAHLSGNIVAFTPHVTAGAAPTLAVDGLTAKPIRSATSADIASGTLVAGTPYLGTYNNADGVFYLYNFFANSFNIPIGGMMPYLSSTAPNSAFVLPYGQAISRTTYATLFALCGTTFGTGDGSTTFNIPDLRGRIPVGKDDMGGSAASRVTSAGSSVDGLTIGATGGAQNVTISQANLPNVNFSSASLTGATTVTGQGNGVPINAATQTVSFAAGGLFGGAGVATLGATTTIGGNVPSGGSGTALVVMQPSMVLPWILRIV